MKNCYEKVAKISVIVPVYRVEKYLKRCLDSIINQTYTNLEIILIDDGSDDGCGAICDSYASKDSRVKVIHQTNKGLSASRNIGLKQSTGDFVAFVDSDDYINCHMFEHMMDALVDNNADIAMCDFKYVYDENILDEAREDDHTVRTEVISSHDAQYLMCKDLNARITYTVAWNKLYKKELFDEITYPEGRIHEDEARTHELLYKAEKIAYVKCRYYYYYQRNNSISSDPSTVHLQLIDAYIDRLAFYRGKEEYTLWSMEAVHAMRTYIRLNYEFDKANLYMDFKKLPQYTNLKTELKTGSKHGSYSIMLLLEIHLFSICYRLYYRLYKIRKRIKGYL